MLMIQPGQNEVEGAEFERRDVQEEQNQVRIGVIVLYTPFC